MNAKEKAVELVSKYSGHYRIENEQGAVEFDLNGKANALICVDELIKAFEELSIEDSGSVFRDFGHGYWREVRQEIELL